MPADHEWMASVSGDSRNGRGRAIPLALLLVLAACGEPEEQPEVPAAPVAEATPSPEFEEPDTSTFVAREETVDASFGKVLVEQLDIENAAHAESGRLMVSYLGADGEVAKEYPEAVVIGSWGTMGEWHVDRRFSDYPVLLAEGGGTWQGITCSWMTFTELQPEGPVELLTLMTSYDDRGFFEEGASAIDGELVNIGKDGSLTFRFEGTRDFTAEYRRKGDEYVLASAKDTVLDGC